METQIDTDMLMDTDGTVGYILRFRRTLTEEPCDDSRLGV